MQAKRLGAMVQREPLQAPLRGEPQAVLGDGVRSRDQLARAKDLGCDNPDECFAHPEWKQTMSGRKDQPMSRQQPLFALAIESLERHPQPSGECANVSILGDVA
jgi:hypothetical protein